MKMTVIGTGYLGATHAACMAELGHEVLGVDVDEAKIASLQAGTVPFYEAGLLEILERNLGNKHLGFSSDYADAAEFATVHFLAVGTPQERGSYAADMTYVNAVIDTLVPLLRGEHVIVGKSTVPVGTAAALQERADALVQDASVEIIWNPEFLRESHGVEDTIHPDRIVIGLREGSQSEGLMREIYASQLAEGTPFLSMDLATAELVKVSANSFLATKISFINAVAEVCEAAGADVVKLAEALGLDDRIGPKFLGAGLGFGGGCLPKDLRAFMARSAELGANLMPRMLREVDSINMNQRNRLVQKAQAVLGGSVLGRRITILGAAFKANSDDVRDSPALNVAGQLSLAGAAVSVYDPQAMDNARREFPTLNYGESLGTVLEGAELVILATEWQEFREMDPVAVGSRVQQQVLIDGRNVLNAADWKAAGWEIHAMGRSL